MWPPNSPDLNPVNDVIWSVIQLDAAGIILRVHYKVMKCDVSFSLGNVSTLFRWGGHFCHVCVKHFFLLTTVQKYKNPLRFSRVTATFYGSQCLYANLRNQSILLLSFSGLWAADLARTLLRSHSNNFQVCFAPFSVSTPAPFACFVQSFRE